MHRLRIVAAFCLTSGALTARTALSLGFTTLPPMGTARTTHSATLLNDGTVLIAGGINQNGVVKTAELFDPRAATFSRTGDPLRPRYLHSATLLPDGRVLLVGGIGRSNVIVAGAEIYDPRTRVFSAAAKLALPRFEHRATRLNDGRVLITGGYGLGQMAGRAEIYDPVTDRFTEVGDLLRPRAGHVALLLPSGNVFLAGGRGYSYQGNPQIPWETGWKETEIFDVRKSSFELAGTMSMGRPDCTGVVLSDGRPAVFGGGDTVDVLSAEFCDLATGKFTRVSNPGGGRLETATVLQDGRVVFIGGLGLRTRQDNVLPSISFYDPRSDQFIGAGGPVYMQEPRHSHTATLLQDGRVLVTGGVNRRGALRSADLLSP